MLCHDGLRIMPKHVLEPAYKSGNFASAYNVGTPPEHDRRLVVRFDSSSTCPARKPSWAEIPYYYGFDQNKQRLPYLNEVVFLIVPDQDAADLKFRRASWTASTTSSPKTTSGTRRIRQKNNFTLHDLGPGVQYPLPLVQPEQGAAAFEG